MFIDRGEETGGKANFRQCRKNMDNEEAIEWGRENSGPESKMDRICVLHQVS